ncbi:Fc.00g012480.m01.CDS01 [Cosmosporella sp. VM-42]
MFPFQKPLAVAAAAFSLLPVVYASARDDFLPGYGKAEYDPPCIYACTSAVPSMLDCPEYANMTAAERAEAYPSASCYAQDKPYLSSVALCISSHCLPLPFSRIDKFWENELFYEEDAETMPVLTYSEALALVDLEDPPLPLSINETVLNRTVSIDDVTWVGTLNAITNYKGYSLTGFKYMLLVFLSGVAMPFGFTALSLAPFPSRWVSTFNAYFIDPPVFGRRHSVPVLGLAMVPTRGQAIFILYLIAINLVAVFHGYPHTTPDAWYPDRKLQLTYQIANRAGWISLANMPLVYIYGGRNSMLLWLSNWSHASYLLMHRWVALICVLQACLHSAMWLEIEVKADYYSESVKEKYWIYGIVATCAFTLLTTCSVLPIRKYWYEAFLIGHIILAMIAVVGVYYHVVELLDHEEGADIWVYIAIGVWIFDRFMRWLRAGKRGVKRAYVTRVDEEYIRVDVPGVDCSGYCYAYFPSLSWKVWENHPFSVVGSNPGADATVLPSTSPSQHSDSEGASPTSPTLAYEPSRKEAGFTTKTRSITPRSIAANGKNGISLYIRVHKGITSLLASKAGNKAGIPVLIEGSYGHEGKTVLQGAEAKFSPTPDYPNMICIAGGVGVTAVLPALNSSLSLYGPMGTTKLFWGLRNRGLVESIEGILASNGDVEKPWGHIEPHITVGSRLNVRQILEEELGECSAGTTVVVCGPNAMNDEVRYTCAAMARHGRNIRFVEEALPW